MSGVKAAGARAIVTSSSDEKLARARSLGADCTVNYATNPFISASANPVFDRANKALGRTVKTFRNGMTYDEIAELDTLLVDYFALAKIETTEPTASEIGLTIRSDAGVPSRLLPP